MWEEGRHAGPGDGGGVWDGDGASSVWVQGGTQMRRLLWRPGQASEHTRNICFMVVTLDVSKLSG